MSTPTLRSEFLASVACILVLSAVGSVSYGAEPHGVSPPGGKQWTMTFETGGSFANPFLIQYVRAWRLDPRGISSGSAPAKNGADSSGKEK